MRLLSAVSMVLFVAAAGCNKPCASDGECDSNQYCDPADSVCRRGLRAPADGGVNGASSSSSGSSSGAASSSSSGGPLVCPDDCATLVTGAHHVLSWSCQDGGVGASACLAQCETNFRDCETASPDCETDVRTSNAHCGACNSPAASASTNRCVGGVPVCGDMVGPCTMPLANCAVTPDGGASCFGCGADSECTRGTEVCCQGVCTNVDAACGCDLLPSGANAGQTCMATGVGGQCVRANGQVATGSQVHNGVCGCGVPGGQLVEEAVCASQNGFAGLCAPNADGGGTGQCVPQNSPPSADGGSPAGNCGELGRTCSPSQGGPECHLSTAGVGVCGCSQGTLLHGCDVPESDLDGGLHQVATGCSDPQSCVCSFTGQLCNPNGANPDCCTQGCVSLATDPANCGSCGLLCRGGNQGCGSGGLNPGQCACTANFECDGFGGGGGTTCSDGGCVCPHATGGVDPPGSCPPGTFCSVENALGCCEWGIQVSPNSCLPPSLALPACAVEAAHPRRRICFNTGSTASCCDNGCTPSGTCQPL